MFAVDAVPLRGTVRLVLFEDRNEMSVKVEKKDHLIESCTRAYDSPPVKSADER